MMDVLLCLFHLYRTCQRRRDRCHLLSSRRPQTRAPRLPPPGTSDGPGRRGCRAARTRLGGSLRSGAICGFQVTARRETGESCGTGVGGLGLPAGCWPPVTSGRLRARTCQRDFPAGDVWRSRTRARLWHQHTPRCCVILLTRPARASSPSPVQWRQSHPPFSGASKTTQGLTLVKGRAQREHGRGVRRSSGSKRWEWTGRRPGQGGHGTPPLPWPLWPGGFSAVGEGLPPTGSPF